MGFCKLCSVVLNNQKGLGLPAELQLDKYFSQLVMNLPSAAWDKQSAMQLVDTLCPLCTRRSLLEVLHELRTREELEHLFDDPELVEHMLKRCLLTVKVIKPENAATPNRSGGVLQRIWLTLDGE